MRELPFLIIPALFVVGAVFVKLFVDKPQVLTKVPNNDFKEMHHAMRDGIMMGFKWVEAKISSDGSEWLIVGHTTYRGRDKASANWTLGKP